MWLPIVLSIIAKCVFYCWVFFWTIYMLWPNSGSLLKLEMQNRIEEERYYVDQLTVSYQFRHHEEWHAQTRLVFQCLDTKMFRQTPVKFYLRLYYSFPTCYVPITVINNTGFSVHTWGMAQKRKLDSARMASMYCRQSFACDSAFVIIAFKHFTAFWELSGCFKSCTQKSQKYPLQTTPRQNSKYRHIKYWSFCLWP